MFTWMIAVCVFIAGNAQFSVSEVVAPYAIFSTRFGIYRVRLNESSSVENVIVGGYGYGALDYHYSEDLLFWINDATNTIHKAKLSDGSNSGVITRSNRPVDIAVDWINNMLYWVDSAECNIHELDLNTNSTRIVLTTGTQHTSFPRGIAIYPYKNNGWLYWTDVARSSMEMGSIHGGVRKSIVNYLPCIHAITIDCPNHTVYWSDVCEYNFRSISLSGDRKSLSYPVTRMVFFVSSAATFKDSLYWVEPSGIYTVKSSGEGYRTVMSARRNNRPVYMKIVDPSLQPPESDYQDMIRSSGDSGLACNPSCGIHGTCIPPGLCACSKGWMGASCSEDVDECSSKVHDCEQSCVNTEGSYNCGCNSGYILNDDKHTCTKA